VFGTDALFAQVCDRLDATALVHELYLRIGEMAGARAIRRCPDA
jgi:hypothetical protein